MFVSDDRTGERVACAKCQESITVPVPIGGRLTEYRLKASPNGNTRPEWPPPKLQQQVDEPAEPLAEEDAAFTDLPPDPGMGFRTQIQLPKLLRRSERPAIEESAHQMLGDIVAHMEAAPQDFQSGSLILQVDRYELDPEKIDVRMRLFGTVNGERFTAPAQRLLNRQLRRSLIGMLTELVGKVLFPGAQDRIAHKTIRGLLGKQLCEALDETVGKPPGLWKRLGRYLAGP